MLIDIYFAKKTSDMEVFMSLRYFLRQKPPQRAEVKKKIKRNGKAAFVFMSLLYLAELKSSTIFFSLTENLY